MKALLEKLFYTVASIVTQTLFHLIEQLTVLESSHKMLTILLLLIVALFPNSNEGIKKNY